MPLTIGYSTLANRAKNIKFLSSVNSLVIVQNPEGIVTPTFADEVKVIELKNCFNYPIGCGIMFRQSHIVELGLYDEKQLIHEEKDLRTRFLKKYKIKRVQLPLYRYRKHKNNMTNNEELMLHYEKMLLKKKNE